jgi:hypothetical protein
MALVDGDVQVAFHGGGVMELEWADWKDANGNPAGGVVNGNGIHIRWQNGPLGRGKKRKEPNGAFVEDVIRAAIHRLRWYQGTRFPCRENENALVHMEAALAWLEKRTERREREGTEGTHEQGSEGFTVSTQPMMKRFLKKT